MRCELAMPLSNWQVRNITCLIDAYFEATNLPFACQFSVFCNGDIGDRNPTGNLSPCGDGDGETPMALTGTGRNVPRWH